MALWTRRAVLGTPFALTLRGAVKDSRNGETPDAKTEFTLRRFASLAEWEPRKTRIKRQILLAAGLDPMPPRGKVNTVRGGRAEHTGFVTECVWVETLPGLWIAANLYRPATVTGKVPAVLIAHGHWKNGRLHNQEDYSTPQLAANLALQGYVALAYDMLHYNESRQLEHNFGKSDEERAWNYGPLGVQLFNSTRMLDFLLSLDDVDPARVVMTGASGGGTQTFLLSAVDERVKAAIPVNMLSAHFQGDCDCEGAPGLRWDTNNIEIASMVAPRPQLIVAATGDWTKNVPRVEYPAVKQVYELYGEGDAVHAWQLKAGHNYNKQTREAVYAYLASLLKGSDRRPQEKDDAVDITALQFPSSFPMPAGAKTSEQIFEDWRQRARDEAKLLSAGQRRERLALILGATWPPSVDAGNGEQIVLTRPDRGDQIPARIRSGSGPAVLVVHPDGSKAAMESESAKSALASGATVLAIDAFQTGDAKAGRDRGGSQFLAYNATDDACRVQDVVTAIAYLHSLKPSKLTVTGIGEAAVWTHLAKACAPVEVALEQTGTPTTEAELSKRFNAPGVLYAGGGLPS